MNSTGPPVKLTGVTPLTTVVAPTLQVAPSDRKKTGLKGAWPTVYGTLRLIVLPPVNTAVAPAKLTAGLAGAPKARMSLPAPSYLTVILPEYAVFSA